MKQQNEKLMGRFVCVHCWQLFSCPFCGKLHTLCMQSECQVPLQHEAGTSRDVGMTSHWLGMSFEKARRTEADRAYWCWSFTCWMLKTLATMRPLPEQARACTGMPSGAAFRPMHGSTSFTCRPAATSLLSSLFARAWCQTAGLCAP